MNRTAHICVADTTTNEYANCDPRSSVMPDDTAGKEISTRAEEMYRKMTINMKKLAITTCTLFTIAVILWIVLLHLVTGARYKSESTLQVHEQRFNNNVNLTNPKFEMVMQDHEQRFNNKMNLTNQKFEMVMQGARSCADLRANHSVSMTGYYLMRIEGFTKNEPTYQYCDFHVYQGVSTCAQLVSNYNISRYGYYQFESSNAGFHYCPDVYTCYHLAQRDGFGESGFYRLGSPGEYYQAFCNFFSGQAVTEVWHNSEIEIKASNCETNGCYKRVPQYNIDGAKILKIMQGSKSCRQFIKYRCKGSMLFRDNYGLWVARDGERMRYWGGAGSKRTGYCACGETGSCIDAARKCNCDNNDVSVITQDEGYLYDKSKLPVKEMRFGDMGDSGENGWHTLGKLECSGEAN